MTVSLGREHTLQSIYIIGTLSLAAGSMLAGAVWWLSSDINQVANANNAAMGLMDRRVTTLEVQDSNLSRSLDRLSTTNDQLREALTELGTAVTKLESATGQGHKR